jgi:hypothetical protein
LWNVTNYPPWKCHLNLLASYKVGSDLFVNIFM